MTTHTHRPLLVRDQTKEDWSETVYVIDQDTRVQAQLAGLLGGFGLKMVGFSSASEYLNFDRRDSAACLILDMRLRNANGLELQQRLAECSHTPTIIISCDYDVRSTVSAMKAGAIELLTKPIDQSDLIDAVYTALNQDRRSRRKRAEIEKLQRRLSSLTRREREVLPLIVGGLLNKQAASVLGISETTLQVHRSQVMRKMEADSFADLVRMAVKLHIPHYRELERSFAFPAQVVSA